MGIAKGLGDAGKMVARALGCAYRLGVLVLALLLCLIVWGSYYRPDVRVLREHELHVGNCTDALRDELLRASLRGSEVGHLGVCNPVPQDLARFFPQLDEYDEVTERVLWAYAFRPYGVVLFYDSAIDVVGEEGAQGELWYFKVPAECVKARGKVCTFEPVG